MTFGSIAAGWIRLATSASAGALFGAIALQEIRNNHVDTNHDDINDAVWSLALAILAVGFITEFGSNTFQWNRAISTTATLAFMGCALVFAFVYGDAVGHLALILLPGPALARYINATGLDNVIERVKRGSVAWAAPGFVSSVCMRFTFIGGHDLGFCLSYAAFCASLQMAFVIAVGPTAPAKAFARRRVILQWQTSGVLIAASCIAMVYFGIAQRTHARRVYEADRLIDEHAAEIGQWKRDTRYRDLSIVAQTMLGGCLEVSVIVTRSADLIDLVMRVTTTLHYEPIVWRINGVFYGRHWTNSLSSSDMKVREK